MIPQRSMLKDEYGQVHFPIVSALITTQPLITCPAGMPVVVMREHRIGEIAARWGNLAAENPVRQFE